MEILIVASFVAMLITAFMVIVTDGKKQLGFFVISIVLVITTLILYGGLR